MRKIKVAIIRKEYEELHGGAERYSVSLARGLAGLGHNVHVFAGKFGIENNPNITIHRVPFIRKPSPLKNFSFQHNVKKLLACHDFDIVHGLSQVFPQDVYRLGDGLHLHWLRLQNPNPLKRFTKYLSPRHQVILSIEKSIFKKGNYRRVIVNSLMCKNQLISYYGVPEKNIRLIYNGVDLNRFNAGLKKNFALRAREKFGIKETETVLLFAGHNYKRKGLEFAIRCAVALKEQGHRIKLIVAGRGNPRSFLRVLRNNRFSEIFMFLGEVINIEDIYQAADILIHPAIYEPFSNVCLEAMAYGLPVVTTKQNGASEIIEDGISGFVVEFPWEVERMVSSISSLLQNKGEALKLMSDCSARCAANYSIEKNIQKTIDVYEEVLSEKEVLCPGSKHSKG